MKRKNKTPHETTLLFNKSVTSQSKLKLFPSKITPYVLIDPTKQILLIKGKSSPEDTIKFYNLIFVGLKNYALTGKNNLYVHICLTYFNSSTAKCLFDLMKHLRKLQTYGLYVQVNWYYEEDDEDMLEAGEDYKMVSKIPFRFVPLDVTVEQSSKMVCP